MVLVKRCIFLLLVLASFLAVRVSLKDTTAGPDVYLEGRKTEPEARAIQAGTVTYVNLALLRQTFNISTIWRQADQQLYFKKGSVHYTFHAGSNEYSVSRKNHQRKKLKAPLLEKEGELWMPLEFLLEQGLVLKRQSNRKLLLTWQNNYLLGVENSLYQGRPAFEIIGSKKIKIIKYKLKSRPLRVVCELDGILPSDGMATVFSSEHPLIKQIRWK
ncbi:MAG TPA: stalk domain-containing protein, partial [Bacillota bacterium]|nr:stalk domain-containing protein [Bacillota bacterium]